MAMFNINRLVDYVGRIYDHSKRKIVQAMKSDGNTKWKQRGLRFDVFRPKHENPVPSEWYIALYAMLNPAAMLGFRPGREMRDLDPDEVEKANRFQRFSTFVTVFGNKTKPTEAETEIDQPRVM